jgi:hypothetical protein
MKTADFTLSVQVPPQSVQDSLFDFHPYDNCHLVVNGPPNHFFRGTLWGWNKEGAVNQSRRFDEPAINQFHKVSNTLIKE